MVNSNPASNIPPQHAPLSVEAWLASALPPVNRLHSARALLRAHDSLYLTSVYRPEVSTIYTKASFLSSFSFTRIWKKQVSARSYLTGMLWASSPLRRYNNPFTGSPHSKLCLLMRGVTKDEY